MNDIFIDQLLEQFRISDRAFVIAKRKSIVEVSFSVLFADFLQRPFASVCKHRFHLQPERMESEYLLEFLWLPKF